MVSEQRLTPLQLKGIRTGIGRVGSAVGAKLQVKGLIGAELTPLE